jgi:exonuclease VII small subunit
MNHKVEIHIGNVNVGNHFFATLDEANAFVELFNSSKHSLDNSLAMYVNAY